MIIKADKNKLRQQRHLRVRNHIHGTAERPRFYLFNNGTHIYVQIIDDEKGVTLTAASSVDKWFSLVPATIDKVAQTLGAVIAKKALGKGITEVVFDIGKKSFNRRSTALLLKAAREGGLKIQSKGGFTYCWEMK